MLFVQEAETLATMGIASLLVELPFKTAPTSPNNNAGDADVIRNAVIDARRALDWAATTGIQHRPRRRGRTSLRRLGWRAADHRKWTSGWTPRC